MTRPTKAQVREAARVAGLSAVDTRSLRRFAEALSLVADRDDAAVRQYAADVMRRRVEAQQREAAAEAKVTRDYVHNPGPKIMYLRVSAGDTVDHEGVAQTFANAGTFSLPVGASCVWVHPTGPTPQLEEAP